MITNSKVGHEKPVLYALRVICAVTGVCKPEDIADYLDCDYKRVVDVLFANRHLLVKKDGFIVGEVVKERLAEKIRKKNVIPGDDLWKE